MKDSKDGKFEPHLMIPAIITHSYSADISEDYFSVVICNNKILIWVSGDKILIYYPVSNVADQHDRR